MRADTNFVVIDLATQASAVAAHVRGWTKDQILEWLKESGTVTALPEMFGKEIHLFNSRIGVEVAFYLDDDQFTLLATIQPGGRIESVGSSQSWTHW